MLDPTGAVWRKSTRSGNGGNCVEVATNLDVVLMRDSKNPDHGFLSCTRDEWNAFLSAVKDGEFEL